jgi:hypothetical protein
VADTVANPISSDDALKEFQVAKLSKEKKSSEAYGLAIAKKIAATTTGETAYFAQRNARFQKNRKIASAKLNIQELFQDRLDMSGKDGLGKAQVNYVNLNWSCIKLAHRICSGLVGRFMDRREKVSVTAKDPLSLKEKQEEYENIEFYLENKRQLQELEAESGVQIIPKEGMPEDMDGLFLWATQIQRLPEEICFEMGCNDVIQSNGFTTTMKEVLLGDAVIDGFVGTETTMDEYGVIHVDRVKPDTAFYSHSEFPDFRDTSFRGRFKAFKISELRRKYGVEFGGTLTEEKIFEIASKSKEYNDESLTWNERFANTDDRPYDEWNVNVMVYELKSVDCEPLTIVKTKKHKSTIIKKGKPEKAAENEKVEMDTYINIYRGAYIPDTETLLEWGPKMNMIRPQDPKEAGNAEFSFSFYMYQAEDGYNLAVPEKIEEPLFEMIHARLKMQQLVGKMKPAGAAINVDAMQELDLGLGRTTSPMEAKRIWEQTGDLFFRGMDSEGRPIPVPIQELANAGFFPQMQALMELYRFHYSVLKDELGEDPNMITQALQPRVAQGNVDASQQASAQATDYMYRAFLRLMEDTSAKVACLLHKSVMYGSNVFRALMGREDVVNRKFSTAIEMLPSEFEQQRLEANVQQALATNPELTMFISPMQIMRIAKENVKLAEELFTQAQKKALQFKQEYAAQNQQQIIEGQMKSAQVAEQAKQQTEDLKGQIDIEKARITGEAQNKSAVLNGMLVMYQKAFELGKDIPAEIKPLMMEVLKNVALPAAIENEQIRNSVAQQMEAAAQQPQVGQQSSMPVEQPMQQQTAA